MPLGAVFPHGQNLSPGEEENLGRSRSYCSFQSSEEPIKSA